MEETLSMNNEDGKRSSIVPRPKGIPMTNMGVSRIQSLCMLKRCAMTRLVISKSYSPRLKGHASARPVRVGTPGLLSASHNTHLA